MEKLVITCGRPNYVHKGEIVLMRKRREQVKVTCVHGELVYVRLLKWYEAILFNLGRLIWGLD